MKTLTIIEEVGSSQIQLNYSKDLEVSREDFDKGDFTIDGVLIKNHYEQAIYSTSDKKESVVDYIGEIKSGYTETKPTEFDEWDNSTNTWVEDTTAKTESEFKVKQNAIRDKISKIIDDEAIDKDSNGNPIKGYFHNLGFTDGLVSVAKYPTNADAKKISAWAEACWVVVETKQAEILAGTLDIDTIDDAYLTANLPKVEDV
jgi:hypothetical protein